MKKIIVLLGQLFVFVKLSSFNSEGLTPGGLAAHAALGAHDTLFFAVWALASFRVSFKSGQCPVLLVLVLAVGTGFIGSLFLFATRLLSIDDDGLPFRLAMVSFPCFKRHAAVSILNFRTSTCAFAGTSRDLQSCQY